MTGTGHGWRQSRQTAGGCVRWHRGPIQTWPFTAPHTVGLQLVLEGSATCLIRERRMRVDRATLLFLPPGVRPILLDASPTLGLWCASLQQSFLHRALPSAARAIVPATPSPSQSPAPIVRRLAEAEARGLSFLLSGLPASRSAEAHDAGLAYAVATAWDLVGASALSPAPRELHAAVAEAARLISSGSRRIGRTELAGRCGVSESQLSRLFKRHTGLSIAEYRNRHRLACFLELYGSGERFTLVEAALEAGFGSYAQFHRVFKRVMARGPAEYARSQRRTHGLPA